VRELLQSCDYYIITTSKSYIKGDKHYKRLYIKSTTSPTGEWCALRGDVLAVVLTYFSEG
jgi:hypothetical protein